MKLNSDSKDKIRKEIEKRLNEFPEGERMKLDKDLLEELMFKKCYINSDGKNVLVKYIVWNGPFLSKIDLSEVSFDNVEWRKNYFDIYGDDIEQIEDYYEDMEKIILSNTNARIDFSKSFQILIGNDFVDVRGVDFSNTDLSNSNLISYANWIWDTDLRGTNITSLKRDKKIGLCLADCNLEGLNLSDNFVEDINFDINNYDHNYDCDLILDDCNLKNTKLNIRFHKNSRYICNENFKKMLEDGLLQGCYLNGKLIKSISEKLELKEKILEDYINFENSQFNSVISSIDKQVSRAKK